MTEENPLQNYESLGKRLKECESTDEVLDVFDESQLGIQSYGGNFDHRWVVKRFEDGILLACNQDTNTLYTLIRKHYTHALEIQIKMPKKPKPKEDGLVRKLLTAVTGG